MVEKIYAKINTLEKMAKEYYLKAIPEDEIAEQDITDILIEEIPFMLENEVLSIGITGKTKSSKSTLMLLFLWWILRRYFKTMIELKHVCAEQYEYGRKIIQEELHDTILGIDEFGALEETGYNATIEQKYLEQFSDLQAQRNIHRIMCAPRKVFDINANVIIRIVSKDSARFLTHAQVYYKIETPNYVHTQLIGRITINVKPIMFEKDGWEQMKKDYQKEWKQYKKEQKTAKEEWKEEYGTNEDGFFKYIRIKNKLKEFGEKGYGQYQRPIYHRYRKRKFEKMKLLNKEGITQMREMEFAELYLEIFKKLLPISKVMRVTKDMIEGKAAAELKKRKMLATIFTMEILKSRVNSLVQQTTAIETLRARMIKAKNGETRKTLKEAITESTHSLQEEINSLNRLVAVSKKYRNI